MNNERDSCPVLGVKQRSPPSPSQYHPVPFQKLTRTKAEGSTRLTYTGCLGGMEHLKIETRLIDERFASVMGECVQSLLFIWVEIIVTPVSGLVSHR
jgi:hypothetical protein